MRRSLIVPLLAAAMSLALGACGKQAADSAAAGGPPGGMPPMQVETVRVHAQRLPNQFETVGTLRADESVMLRPEVAGEIETIDFNEGERVAAGQVLFTLDSALVRAAANEAEANLVNARRAFARATDLAAKQLIAGADLDTKRAELAVAQARAASARTRLQKARITAPFAGVTGLRNVSAGDYVEVGQELVQLVRLDPIELDLRAPEVVLSSLAVGQTVLFGVDAYRDERFEAKVVAIAPTVDAGGRSVALRASLSNPDLKLRPGMSARVRITLSTSGSALLVPEQAVWPMGEQKTVFVIDQGKAKQVPVELGTRLPGQVEVTSGLKDGDEVVVAGQLKLRDGAPAVGQAPNAAGGKPADAKPDAKPAAQNKAAQPAG
jgi:membrane fusion protein, multidrug efflux system